jgi:PIN domain nuclease of toxin-antitoxin system
VRLLLDTHTLLWLAHQPQKLSPEAAAALADDGNEVWVSAVSAIEIATKHRKGTLEYDTSLAVRFVEEVTAQNMRPLSITCEHAQRAGALEGAHKDPWDRLLAAQAQLEGLTLVSDDQQMKTFGISPLW